MAESMVFDVSARDNASAKLAEIGRNVDKLADKLDALGRKDVKPKITLDSDRATTRLTEFSRALRDISNKRVRVDVDITGRSEVGDLRRELAYMTDRKVKIRVDTADSNQRLRTITDRLRTIQDTRAKIDIQVRNEAKLDEILAKLTAIRDMSPVVVVVDVQTGSAVRDLRDIDRLLGRINGTRASASVDIKSKWDKSIEGKFASLSVKLLAIPAAASAASSALGLVGGAAASLVGGLAQAGQAAGILPGALAAVGAVAGTVTLGLQGLGDAFEAVAEGDPEKLAEAMKGLSASGRELVSEVGRLKPAWDALQLDVQQRLLAGLGQEAAQLGRAYLPSLRSGLGGIATELNTATRGVTDFLQTGEAVSRVDSIFRSTRLAVADIAPAADDVTAAFLDIAEVGASMLPELTSGAEGAAQSFRAFIAEARATGELQAWIQTGIDRIKQLGDIAGNVGGIVGGVFTAANAEGADFLTLLQQGTQSLRDFVNSAEGQNALRAFFQESRQTVDALVPGLVAARDAVSGFMQGFNQTDGLARFAAGVSDAAESVGPLVASLGQLAGNTLASLGAGLTNTAALLSPVTTGLSWLLDVLGPIPGAVTAMVLAFAGMRLVGGYVATAGLAITALGQQAVYASYGMSGALAGAAGAAGTAMTTLGRAVSAAAKALPLVGAAVIGLSVIWDQFVADTDEAASSVIRGQQTMGQAIQATAEIIDRNGIDWLGGADAQQAYARASDEVRAKVEAQLVAMGGMQELQGRVTVSQGNLNDAVVRFGPNSEEARRAAEVLARDQGNLENAQNDAADAADRHSRSVKDLADSMSSAVNAHLDYEDAVSRTAEAQKEADEALKSGNVEAYATEVRDLASAFEAQAQAARRNVEAHHGAEAGAAAYVQELMRLNNGSKAGRDALLKLAEGMTRADRDAFNAAASATGLNTEIVKLPDGKEIRLVVAADASAIPTVEAQIKTITDREYLGMIKVLGDATMADGTIMRSVEFANGQTGTMRVDADAGPASVVVEGQRYTIDQTTGVMKIDGDPAPGLANLDGFRVRVDETTGAVTIEALPGPAEGKLSALVGQINTARGVVTIDGDSTLADGKTTAAVRFADGSRGTITIDGNEQPVNGKIRAQVTYADGSVGTITLDANDQQVIAAQNNARLPISSSWTPQPNTTAVDAARRDIAKPITVPVRFTSTGEVIGGKDTSGLARGGLMAPSGVQLYAGGGTYQGHRLAPMAVGQAAAVPPNTWRVVGDRSDVVEAYIPWKPGDKRANRLLDMTAAALGRTVLPMALGGILAFAPGGVASPTATRPVPAASTAAAPTLDPAYANALKAAADSGAELNDIQQLVTDTATALGEQTALTTEQVQALTAATQEATTADQAYQVGLDALRLANDTVTVAAQTRTAAEQVATEVTAVALGQAQAYTGGLTSLGVQAGGATTGGINALTGAVQGETSTEGVALGQTQAYTGGLATLGGQAGGATTGGMNTLTGAVNASGAASATATGQAQGHTSGLAALGAQAGGGTASGLQGAAAAAQAQGSASAAAGAQAQGQSGDLQALAGSAGQAAGELQGVATAINNLPDGEFVVTANGRMGEISGSPTVRAATGGVLPGYTPGRDVHTFTGPAGRLELSGGEAVMRPEWTKAVGPDYVHAANAAARKGQLPQFLRRTAPREGQNTQGDGSMLATGGIWNGPGRVQRYALGGVIGQQGNPFPPMPTDLWDELAGRMADAMTPVMQQAVKDAEVEAMGGDALAWARTQVGKPYQWGGVGPGGYDCSGFMSAILNVMNGRPPHSRVGSTASFPWAGFSPGIGGRFSIGAFKGNPGHMAGTLAGTNVESSGSVGVRVGGGARGAGDGMFNIRAHVASGGILPKFDQGGLATGRGLMLKDIIRPERILDANTTKAFDRLATVLPQAMSAQPGRVQLGRAAVSTPAGGGVNVGQYVAAMAAQMNRQVAAIQSVAADLAQRPTVTVNDTSGNPVEAGRAAALAYRMAR